MRKRGIASIAAMVAAAALSGCTWITQADIPLPGMGTTQNELTQPAYWPSGNGRYVYFNSSATNLVPQTAGLDPLSSDFHGILRRDNKEGRTILLRSGAALASERAIAQDQRRILVYTDGYELWDRDARTDTPVAVDSNEAPLPGHTVSAALSADGGFVALRQYVNVSPRAMTTYVRDLRAGTTKLVATVWQATDNVYMEQELDRFSLSRDGAFLAQSTCTKSVFIHGTPSCELWNLRLVDVANGTALSPAPDQPSRFDPALSDDGRILAYQGATLVTYNRVTGITQPVAVGTDGLPAGGFDPSLSANGRYVAFASGATNLVDQITFPNRTNIYVRDRVRRSTTIVSVRGDGEVTAGSSSAPAISADGRYVTFLNFGAHLTPDATTEWFRFYTAVAARPHVTAVTPTSGAPGDTVELTVTGYGFRPDVRVVVHRDGEQLATTLGSVTDSELKAEVTVLAGTPAGDYDVTVGNPGGGPGPYAGAATNCAACFSVG
jgi:hypothetical protein